MTIRQLRNYIDGRFEDGASTFDKHSPVDHALIAQAHEASREQVDRAVAAAHRALPAWAALPVGQRTDHLLALADGIDRRFDDFLQAEIGDTGKPVSWASQIDIPRGAANFRTFAELARTLDMESYMTDTPDGRQALNYAYRKPLGVVGVISPWNLPLLLLTWKVAPALAFGNTVIMKPSEVTPSTATLLAEVAHEAGLPPGVLNLTHGFGPGSAGEFITTHPDIDGITFTGESATGAAIMRAVAPGVKPVSFELGGKNAALVFADADFEAAVDGTARSVFANCGQVCLCTERVYVQRPIYERFV
ncbi:aldehyde dehydrogenase family protein, partial [Achromobacter xylosoxidans]|nr:aldehyde dehydrogenase family protein [Achromobacter xylosoxidans]